MTSDDKIPDCRIDRSIYFLLLSYGSEKSTSHPWPTSCFYFFRVSTTKEREMGQGGGVREKTKEKRRAGEREEGRKNKGRNEVQRSVSG